jgi:TrpR-related protein YerC/YecD
MDGLVSFQHLNEQGDNMNSKIKDKNTDGLFEAILSLETLDECYKFFEDLCTVLEIKSLAQRLQVAKMLSEHHVYNDIVNETGASTATISRVNRSLHYGCDGYDIVFSRLKEKKEKEANE